MDKVSSKLLYLRKDRNLSQKQAARDLKISQSLLSHYEKGIRECGIEFLARAADYYDVSTDYLLGRAYEAENAFSPDLQEEDGGAVKNGSIVAGFSKRLVGNSLALIFDLLGESKKNEALGEAALYLYLCVYKLFRMIYRTSGSDEGFFNSAKNSFPFCVESELSLCEMRLIKALQEENESAPLPGITHGYLSEKYPKYASSLLNILHNVDNKIT